MLGRKKLAESIGLNSKSWFSQLSFELGIPERTLRTEMKDFRASNKVSEDIRIFYPTERGIELFGRTFPQIHTIDFILSFLNQREDYKAAERTTFFAFGKEIVDQSRRKHVLSVTKSLDAENLRRNEYWQGRQGHIADVLCGTYIMFRPSLTISGNKSFRNVYTEVMHIRKSKHFPQVLQAYWRRFTQNRKIFYTGNFFISSNFLYGTFVNRSSDEVIKPVNINILSKHASKNSLRRFILTGSLTGTDFAQEKIIHYPIALKRIRAEQIPEPDKFYGVDAVKDHNFCHYADLLLQDPSISFENQDMLAFIKEHHTEFGALALNNLK